eukprot:jgi/Chlat1/7609/Chrsp64S09152
MGSHGARSDNGRGDDEDAIAMQALRPTTTMPMSTASTSAPTSPTTRTTATPRHHQHAVDNADGSFNAVSTYATRWQKWKGTLRVVWRSLKRKAAGKQPTSVESRRRAERRRWIAVACGPLAFVVAWAAFHEAAEESGNPTAARMLALVAWMAVWWLTESVPMAVTALLPAAMLPLLGVESAQDASSAYFNPTITLFIGACFLANAIERVVPMAVALLEKLRADLLGDDARVADGQDDEDINGDDDGDAPLLSPSRQPNGDIEHTHNDDSTAASVEVEEPPHTKLYDLTAADFKLFSRGVVLSVAYAASIGGMATLTGTGTNLILAGVWSSLFPTLPQISFLQFAAFAFPLSLTFLAILWLLACRRFCPPATEAAMARALDGAVISAQYHELGPMSFAEKVVMIDFVVLATLWLTRDLRFLGGLPGWGVLFGHDGHLISDGTVAILMGTVLFFIPARVATPPPAPKTAVSTLQDNGHRIDDTIDMDAEARANPENCNDYGNNPHGAKESGLTSLIAEELGGLSKLPLFLLPGAVAFLVTLVTEFFSNTATITIFLPLLANLALAAHRHPLLLMLPATLASSLAFMLPISTPPNAIAFGTGYVSMASMAVTGFVLNVLGVILITLFTPTLGYGKAYLGMSRRLAPVVDLRRRVLEQST